MKSPALNMKTTADEAYLAPLPGVTIACVVKECGFSRYGFAPGKLSSWYFYNGEKWKEADNPISVFSFSDIIVQTKFEATYRFLDLE